MGETKTAVPAYFAFERGPFVVQVCGDASQVQLEAETYLDENNFFGVSQRRIYESTLPLIVLTPLAEEEVRANGNGAKVKLVSHMRITGYSPVLPQLSVDVADVHEGQLSLEY